MEWTASVLQTLAALALVCAAAVLAIRWWGQHRGPAAGGARLERLALLPLGAGATLQLIRVRERTLLVGVTPQRVTLVQDLTAPLPGDAPPAQPVPACPPGEPGPEHG